MEPNSESMRNGLLARLPQPERLAEYRQEVSAFIEKNEKTVRRQKWYTGAIWIWVVGLGTVFLVIAGRYVGVPRDAGLVALYGSLACFLEIYGGLEMLKMFINRNRVELLKETKQVQLQVLELQSMLRKPGV
jgi:hypothetical protein